MDLWDILNCSSIKNGFTSKLAARINEEEILEDKGPPDQGKDIKDNPCSHAVHSHLSLLTS